MIKGTLAVLPAIVLLASALSVFPADPSTKEEKAAVKIEDRMREEKARDERNARDYASRVKVARFDTVWRSPKATDIDVVQRGEGISKSYKAIALLTFDCPIADETQAIAGFIEMAKALGADGVAFLGYEFNNEKIPFAPTDKRVFRANAFVYLPASK